MKERINELMNELYLVYVIVYMSSTLHTIIDLNLMIFQIDLPLVLGTACFECATLTRHPVQLKCRPSGRELRLKLPQYVNNWICFSFLSRGRNDPAEFHKLNGKCSEMSGNLV